jgi:hypothetical protein
VRAVVRGVEDDGVVDDVEVVQRLEQLTDVAIAFDHAIGVLVVRHPALTAHRRAHMRVGMHARRVHPDKERLVGLHLPLDEAVVSSSIVSIRFLVSGPVSSMVCLPTLPKRGSTVGSSTLLALVGEHQAFLGNAVDVRRAITHQAYAGRDDDHRLSSCIISDIIDTLPIAGQAERETRPFRACALPPKLTAIRFHDLPAE